MVNLLNSHIIIDKNIAEELFSNESYVQVIYYENDGKLMVARDSDDMFKSFHKAKKELLKNKNLLGDKSINIREMIIDNDLDETNRSLEYKADTAMNVLNVFIK
ncbi:hypothetical protein A9P82_00255 [Arachidicoccus ginsenosidimutans]|uniref:hypothetical protein n=1 Tax=Arachidicoccus sp. BS20 TaxID=1850526 RepID=UPI0007F0A10C|nr:hypothetical protein [Arachidicoccus sp. BS20]ANI87889.1 hypothetical protein A9P82_00255 [Arachidicoccus sp. BS20]